MVRALDILATMIGAGMILAGAAGALASSIVAALIMSSTASGILYGLIAGFVFGLALGMVLGMMVGFVAALITLLLDWKAKGSRVYKLCMIAICTPLSAALVYLATEQFIGYDSTILYAMTGFGAFFGLVISYIFANHFRNLFGWNNDRYVLPNDLPVTK